MSRDMRAANAAIFAHLEDYCSRRGAAIPTSGLRRYVQSSASDKTFLKDPKVGARLKFDGHRSLVHLHMATQHFIGLVGFDFEPELHHISPIPINPGIAVCLLAETLPMPTMGPSTVRNIVEVGSMDEGGDYRGHESFALESLFPPLQIVASPQPLDEDSAWRIFLMICAEECRQGASWIEQELAEALVSLTDLSIPGIPYPAICRSMFDADPRTLFMALYRCIEATYAFESSRRVVDRLGLTIPWQDLATALEEEVGWHPQEASSLQVVLRYAVEKDLEELCTCLRVEAGSDVRVSAGRALYGLRNQVVHYRPGMRSVAIDSIDWNHLCRLLVGIVFDVFTRA